jgi:GNAT superfamily N-acetyltransferase
MMLADVDAGLRLCRQSHWNQVARDWERFLGSADGGATVAVDAAAGLVVGSVASMLYRAVAGEGGGPVPVTRAPSPGASVADSRGPVAGCRLPVPDSLAWIAMVLVDPASRGSGIGRALLQRALEQVGDATTIGLDATALGLPLYEKLGFSVECRLTRMRREASSAKLSTGSHRSAVDAGSTTAVRRATPEDRAAIAGLDARATGLDRRTILEWLQEGAPEFAWVADGADGLDGAVLGRHGHAACHLGPVIARSADVAQRLVRACLACHVDRSFFLDVVDDWPGWRTAVDALGFEAQRPFARMYRGPWRPRSDARLLFASIGPEFG